MTRCGAGVKAAFDLTEFPGPTNLSGQGVQDSA